MIIPVMSSTLGTQNDLVSHQELRCLEVWGGSSTVEHTTSVPGLNLSVSSNPQEGEKGGDIYLISSCSSGWISRILLADVAGHGSSVSGLATKLRRAMHKSINTVDQSKFAQTLNGAFDEISTDGRFATALLMTYFAPSRHLILVNAGHPPPLIRRRGTVAWVPLESRSPEAITRPCKEVRVGLTNLPLGVITSTAYEQIAFKLNPGDQVCAYTDAYIEALNPDGVQIGVEGFAAILERTAPATSIESFHHCVHDSMRNHGIRSADDDQTLILIENNGGESPKVSIPIVRNWLKQNFGLGHSDSGPDYDEMS